MANSCHRLLLMLTHECCDIVAVETDTISATAAAGIAHIATIVDSAATAITETCYKKYTSAACCTVCCRCCLVITS